VTKQADLNAYLFDGQPRLLYDDLLHWMEASRFTAFVDAYRDKIRKKIRLAHDPESALDLRSELQVASRLLADRRLEVAYEPYASAKKRSPDFAVTYRANLVFNLEVARIRGEASGVGAAAVNTAFDLPRMQERFLYILLDKLGQMQPGMPNLVLIHAPQELAPSFDLDRLMQEIKSRVEGREPAFYALSGYAGPAAFYKDFLHLSGILLWAAETQSWANKQARPALAGKVLRRVSSLLSGASQT
jgi:hypothetical protein